MCVLNWFRAQDDRSWTCPICREELLPAQPRPVPPPRRGIRRRTPQPQHLPQRSTSPDGPAAYASGRIVRRAARMALLLTSAMIVDAAEPAPEPAAFRAIISHQGRGRNASYAVEHYDGQVSILPASSIPDGTMSAYRRERQRRAAATYRERKLESQNS